MAETAAAAAAVAANLQERPGIFTWPKAPKTNELVAKIRCHSIVHAPPGVCIQEKQTHIHTYKISAGSSGELLATIAQA